MRCSSIASARCPASDVVMLCPRRRLASPLPLGLWRGCPSPSDLICTATWPLEPCCAVPPPPPPRPPMPSCPLWRPGTLLLLPRRCCERSCDSSRSSAGWLAGDAGCSEVDRTPPPLPLLSGLASPRSGLPALITRCAHAAAGAMQRCIRQPVGRLPRDGAPSLPVCLVQLLVHRRTAFVQLAPAVLVAMLQQCCVAHGCSSSALSRSAELPMMLIRKT